MSHKSTYKYTRWRIKKINNSNSLRFREGEREGMVLVIWWCAHPLSLCLPHTFHNSERVDKNKISKRIVPIGCEFMHRKLQITTLKHFFLVRALQGNHSFYNFFWAEYAEMYGDFKGPAFDRRTCDLSSHTLSQATQGRKGLRSEKRRKKRSTNVENEQFLFLFLA